MLVSLRLQNKEWIVDRADWDQLADDFEELVVDVTRDETSDQLSRFVAAARLPKSAVLVDLGCGIGSFIKRFGDRFAEIDGVEHAPKIIARAKAKCAAMKNVRWFTLDVARAAKRLGGRADLTVCMNVITSEKAAERTAQWSGLSTVTKPGGFALIVVPALESEKMVQKHTPASKDGEPTLTEDGLADKAGSWQKHYRRDELTAILSSHGFKVVRIGRVYSPWSREGLRKPRNPAFKSPWDWICLAKRAA
jgi:2-polyprenyl-3-methyl-5-hydroxy-6-metoxy-1,4-benzoquinol methylase